MHLGRSVPTSHRVEFASIGSAHLNISPGLTHNVRTLPKARRYAEIVSLARDRSARLYDQSAMQRHVMACPKQAAP